MLKKLLFIGYVLSLCYACKEQTTYQVKMKLSNLETEQNIYAVFEAPDRKSVDTLFYDGSDELIFQQTQEGFRSLTIYFDNQTKWISAYLEPQQKITITGDANDLSSVRIKGGRVNKLLAEFKKKTASLLNERATLAKPENQEEISRLDSINHTLCIEAVSFIKKHPKEEASAILIRDYFSDPNKLTRLDQLLGELDPELNDFYIVKELKAYSEKAKNTITGVKIPTFNIRNIHGKSYSENSFINRPFILAFITLWRDMHQTDDLLLNEIATLYPEDSVGILVVSMDEDTKMVRELINNDSIMWNIAADSAGQAIELMDQFNIRTMPQSFLMDKEGTIILKTEHGDELKQALSELISSSDS